MSATNLVKTIYGDHTSRSSNDAEQIDVEIKLKNITIRLFTNFYKVNVDNLLRGL